MMKLTTLQNFKTLEELGISATCSHILECMSQNSYRQTDQYSLCPMSYREPDCVLLALMCFVQELKRVPDCQSPEL